MAALAVLATKQDLMILGALPRNERLSLLALLIAEHLKGAPQERVLLLGTRRTRHLHLTLRFACERLENLHRSAPDDVKSHLDLILAQHLAAVQGQGLFIGRGQWPALLRKSFALCALEAADVVLVLVVLAAIASSLTTSEARGGCKTGISGCRGGLAI